MYSGVVTRIHHHPVPELDNLVVGECLGSQVLVSKDTPQDALGIFFETGGQLDEEFCKVNDLIRRKNDDGTYSGGMFDEKRRVRSIVLRGHRSDGFWIPIESINYTGAANLIEGNAIIDACGHHICHKYITPSTSRANNRSCNVGKPRVKQCPLFIEHCETENFMRNVGLIPLGSRITITEKIHGTSHRVGYITDSTEIVYKWWQKPFAWMFRWPKEKSENLFLNGTRKTIIEKKRSMDDGFHGSDQFRVDLTKHLNGKLKLGEIIFGEIVGYANGKPIMSPQNAKLLSDKSVYKQYGETIEYSYGCRKDECKFYVYRITQDGKDLSPLEIELRCIDLDLNTVPYINCMTIDTEEKRLDLKASVELMVNGDNGRRCIKSSLGDNPQEGVVCRVDTSGGTTYFLKAKSFVFGVMEGYTKDDDTNVDMEESS